MYVFTGRIFPLIPTSLINLAAGVSTVTFKDFLLATALGNLIYFFFLSLIPYGLLSVEMNQYTLAALALLFLLFFMIYKRAKKKKKLTFFSKKQVTTLAPVFLFRILHIFFSDSLLKCVCIFTFEMS